VKFTRGRTNPLIQIDVEEKDLTWIISVRDNGIGFDMKYHNKIFEIFQRLQRVEDYPGTGIGLAMVSKAMLRMNGKAWAESVPGIGSTFYLEIPKNI
jgi:light-regulated signal transduction histidine kinase (bacteriophytochrome)